MAAARLVGRQLLEARPFVGEEVARLVDALRSRPRRLRPAATTTTTRGDRDRRNPARARPEPIQALVEQGVDGPGDHGRDEEHERDPARVPGRVRRRRPRRSPPSAVVLGRDEDEPRSSDGTRSRNRPGTTAKTTTAETASATAPPLLCVHQPAGQHRRGETERERPHEDVAAAPARRARARARARPGTSRPAAFTYETAAVRPSVRVEVPGSAPNRAASAIATAPAPGRSNRGQRELTASRGLQR